MLPHMNEDAAWQRLKDLQREAENHRLVGDRASGSGWAGLRGWVDRALLGRPQRHRRWSA